MWCFDTRYRKGIITSDKATEVDFKVMIMLDQADSKPNNSKAAEKDLRMPQCKLSLTRRMTGIVTAVLLLILVFTCTADSIYAADKARSYELVTYDVEITVNKDHSYDIDKILTVNIPNDFTELSVKIPSGHYRIIGIEVKDASYKVSSSGDYKIITITSPDDLTAGAHTYDISYRIQEYADHNSESDIFYFDVLPPDWEIPINNFIMNMTLPDDFEWDDLQYYAGQYGTQDVSNKLSYTVDGNTITMDGDKIPADFGITFKAELPDGYWVDALDNTWADEFSALLMVVALAFIILLWAVGGKDPKMLRTVETGPIEGVTPADVGFLFSGYTRLRDVLAMIIYLAINGNLKIVEYGPKKFKLVKLEEPKSEERFIRNLYNMLFEGVYKGRAVDMSEFVPKLRSMISSIEADVESGYSSSDMRARTTVSVVFRVISIIVLALCTGMIPILSNMYQYRDLSFSLPLVVFLLSLASLLFTSWAFDNRYEVSRNRFIAYLTIGIAVYIVVLIYAAGIMAEVSNTIWILVVTILAGAAGVFFVCIMTARGKGNAKLVAKLLSLRHYIDKSDSGDLALIQENDGNYYYDLYPYAYQFSMLPKWSKKFRWLKVRKAEWYADEISGHAITNANRVSTTIEVARNILAFTRTIESEYRMTPGGRLFR